MTDICSFDQEISHFDTLKAQLKDKRVRAINDSTPGYINNLINVYSPSRSLRSDKQITLSVPKKGSKTYADRAFSHAAPAVWN